MVKFVLFALLNTAVVGTVAMAQYRLFDIDSAMRTYSGRTMSTTPGARGVGGMRRTGRGSTMRRSRHK